MIEHRANARAVRPPETWLLPLVLLAYVIVAATHKRRVQLSDRLRTEYVRWPSDPETDFPGPKATVGRVIEAMP